MIRSTTVGKSTAERRVAWLIWPSLLAGLLAVTVQAWPQAQPAQPKAPVQPTTKTAPAQGAATKKAPATVRPYDRALLHPTLLKDKAPDQYKVKFTTTKGDFVVA